MRKKIIGIFVIMLMITTAIPFVGLAEETEEKNILNQNNETNTMISVTLIIIGTITDKQISGDYITFTTVNAYYLAAVSPFIRNSNNEDMIISKGYLGYCGETFIVGRFSRNV